MYVLWQNIILKTQNMKIAGKLVVVDEGHLLELLPMDHNLVKVSKLGRALIQTLHYAKNECEILTFH